MTEQNAIPPSERAAMQQEADAKVKEHNEAVISMLREDFGRTFQTQHGQRVLAWIMERSGFGKVILSAENNGNLDPMKTTYSAMELNFYLAIRKFISTDVLQAVEYGEVKPSGHIDLDAKPPRKKSKSTKPKGK